VYNTPKKLKKIDVMGVQVPIILNDIELAHSGALGMYKGGAIMLMSQYPSRQDFVDVLFHETFHALCDILGAQLDPNVEEILANTLGRISVSMIQELLRYKVVID